MALPHRDGWRRYAAPLGAGALIAAILIAAVLVMYGNFLVPPYFPKLFGSGYDFSRYLTPQAFYLDHRLHQGEFPFWNPLTLCGFPYPANPQAGAFYPANLIRSLVTFSPTPYRTQAGLAVLMGLHVLLAGAGAYGLGRRYGMSRAAALVTAFGYMFGPYMVFRSTLQWVVVAAAAWFPVVFLLLHGAMTAQRRMQAARYLAAGALAAGLATLAGFPQLIFYAVLSLGFYVLLDAAAATWGSPGAMRAGLKRLAWGYVCLGAIFALAAFVAAALLTPAFELALESARKATGEDSWVNAVTPDLNIATQMQYLLVYCGKASTGLRGCGIGMLLLAVVGLLRGNRRHAAVFGILFVIMADFTLGRPMPFGQLAYLVDIVHFRTPWRAGILMALPLAMLAGFGVDTMVQGAPMAVRRRIVYSAIVAVTAAACLWYVWNWIELHSALPVSLGAVAAPGLLALVVIGVAWSPDVRARRYAGPLLCALVFAEIFVWVHTYMFPWLMDDQRFDPPPAVTARPDKIWQGNARGTDAIPNGLMYAMTPAINGYEPLCPAPLRTALTGLTDYSRFIKDHDVTLDNNRGNLFLKRPFWLVRQYVRGPLPPRDALFPPATTAFYQGTGPLPIQKARGAFSTSISSQAGTTSLGTPEMLAACRVSPLRYVLPVVQLDGRHSALRVTVDLAGEGTIQSKFRLPDGGALPGRRYRWLQSGRHELEFPLPEAGAVQPVLTFAGNRPERLDVVEAVVARDNADEGGLIHVVKRSANAVDLDVDALSGPRLLLFVDYEYAGWQAFVDGAKAPILTVNDAFKGVCLTPGAHRVRFQFRPLKTYAGAGVSIVSTTALLLFLGVSFNSSRLRRAAASQNRT